jgi:peptide/nickel transport system substrate-binding protein
MQTRQRYLAVAVAAALLVPGAAGYGASPASAAPAVSPASLSLQAANTAQPLTVAVGAGGSDSFNPFVLNTTSGPNGQAIYAIYEPLLQFDTVTSAAVPWLATSYQWSNGGRTLSLQLRHGVTWSNGTPFTSADVVFTYDLVKNNPALNQSGITMSSITANGLYAVTLTFPHPEYVNLYYITQTLIVPKALWQDVSDPAKYQDTAPVGTGPYLLQSISLPTVTLTQNPTYWGGEPKVPEVEITGYDSNTNDEEALVTGEAQWNGSTILDVKKIFVDRDPSTNHSWAVESGVISLEPNLKVYPLNLLDVRKAISLVINRGVISTEGEAGASPPVSNQAAVILPGDKAYENPAYSAPYPYSVAKAKALLKAAGLKLKHGHLVGANGKTISLTIEDPSPYTDYVSDAQVIAQELSSIGIDASVRGTSVASWTSDVQQGNFQLIVRYSEGGPNVLFRFDGWLDDTLTAPIGKQATQDFERYANPATQKMLDTAETSSLTSTTFVKAMFGLEKVVATQLPVIPMVYNVEHGNYSTKYYVGWPTASDPYAAATTQNPSFELVLVHLRPAS